MRKIILLALMLPLVASCQNKKQRSADESLRRDIAQMLLVGFRGTGLDEAPHIRRDVATYGIGGVILFEYDVPSQSRPRNIASPTQLRKLCGDLQALSTETLLISIDQEGGSVNRLKKQYGFPEFPSAQSTAEQGFEQVRYAARLTADQLHKAGINLNFAPCVDLNTNPDCPVIGRLQRSFSADPAVVAGCAAIWVDEQRKQHVLSCLKHFPGHGSASGDTHAGAVDVSSSWDTSELAPYRTLIAANKVQMVMTSHVFNSRLDTLPATLSYNVLTGLLRSTLHFDGVIVTDDLAMGAMTKQFSFDTIVIKTVLAGADMLCLSNNGAEYDPDIVPKTIDIIYKAVKQGRIPESRIRESAARIRALKASLR